jgi:aminobenzoyl-glutamate utilization protein B
MQQEGTVLTAEGVSSLSWYIVTERKHPTFLASFPYNIPMRTNIILFALAVPLAAEDGVLTRVAAHADHFGAVSRQIWESPEVGFHETKSSSLLSSELGKAGFTVQEGVAGMPTAFVASWGSGKPVIAVLGEFDALPGLSQKDLPEKQPIVDGGPGHGCGHNLLGSAAALAVVAVKEEIQARGLKGTIRYYGTPAEEGGGGKVFMLNAGLFRDVDVVLAWHPGDRNRANLRSCMAVIGAKFRFHGIASHAAGSPEKGRSALDGAMVMLNAVEFLREHVPEGTRIHYVITNGGSANNVVPAFAEVSLGARHPDAATLNAVWERILKCAQAGALATETQVETVLIMNYANILPNDALTAVVARNLRKAGGYEYTPEELKFAEDIQKTLPGLTDKPGPDKIFTDGPEGADAYSTDVGDIGWNLPTVQFTTATYPGGTPAHSWQATACAGSSIGRKGMVVAARTLALSAMELLTNPNELDAAKTSFEKRRAGRTWSTLITPETKPPLDYTGK